MNVPEYCDNPFFKNIKRIEVCLGLRVVNPNMRSHVEECPNKMKCPAYHEYLQITVGDKL